MSYHSIRNQIVEIDASFQSSKIRPKHEHVQDIAFKSLIGQISQHGIALILEEKRRATDFIKINVDNCGCVLRTAYGLPCAHEIDFLIGQKKPIPLYVFHDFWKQISRELRVEKKIDLDLELDIINAICVVWDGSEEHKRALKRKIIEIIEPSTTVLLEPDEKLKNKGRPRKRQKSKTTMSKKSTRREPSCFEYAKTMAEEKLSQASVTTKRKVPTKPKKLCLGTGAIYLNRIPLLIKPFVDILTNIPSNGHCGFHALALGLKMYGDDSHFQVRRDLLKELESKRIFYESLWGTKEVVGVRNRIDFFESTAGESNWMDILYCGVLASNWYNRYIYFISTKGYTSFLPMFTNAESGFKKKIFGTSLIANHFIYLHLKTGSPLPPVDPHWEHNHIPKANGWLRALKSQMEAWLVEIWEQQEPIRLI